MVQASNALLHWLIHRAIFSLKYNWIDLFIFNLDPFSMNWLRLYFNPLYVVELRKRSRWKPFPAFISITTLPDKIQRMCNPSTGSAAHYRSSVPMWAPLSGCGVWEKPPLTSYTWRKLSMAKLLRVIGPPASSATPLTILHTHTHLALVRNWL